MSLDILEQTPQITHEGVTISEAALKIAPFLTEDVVSLLAELHRTFEKPRQELLLARKARQEGYDLGKLPQYGDQSSDVITSNWKVAPVPADLQCRRVEITGPVNSTKMVINMLSRNSEGYRADCAMLDFEDSMKPSWQNVADGVFNVIGATKGELKYNDPVKGKEYTLDASDMAKVMTRVRGLHLQETNLQIDGVPISAGLFDLVVTAFYTAALQVSKGETPKYYVPKIEDKTEAEWWAALLTTVERRLGLPQSSIRATFLIETLPAAFQIEEILYALRHNVVGLNVGRWDKIFSDIKVLRHHKDRVMADRACIGMNCDWMANYARRLIRVCHKRGAFALGGMAAFTPGRDAKLRESQTAKVVADKKQEAAWGHDGCWVSHPYFIGPAMQAFENQNQLDVIPNESYQCPDLLPRSEGVRTMIGLKINIRVGIAYMKGWLDDIGCVAWDNLMEDLATLEISRAQVWQWLHHRISLEDGTIVTPYLVDGLFDVELNHILDEVKPSDETAWLDAAEAARELFLKTEFQEFLSFASDPV